MFYYYGAKTRLAPLYPKPESELIVEPFAGSAGYSVHHLTKGTAQSALLYDIDPRVVEMWDRLLGMTPDAIMRLPAPTVGSRTSDPLVITVATSNTWGSGSRKAAAYATKSYLKTYLKLCKAHHLLLDRDALTSKEIAAHLGWDDWYTRSILRALETSGHAIGTPRLQRDTPGRIPIEWRIGRIDEPRPEQREAQASERTVTPRMASMWPFMQHRMAKLIPLLKGRVEVHEGSYESIPNIEATWFIDPPYQSTGTSVPNSGYIATVDHQELGRWTAERAGQVIACDQMGADWLPFRTLVQQLNCQGSWSTEVAWCRSLNGEVEQRAVDPEYCVKHLRAA